MPGAWARDSCCPFDMVSRATPVFLGPLVPDDSDFVDESDFDLRPLAEAEPAVRILDLLGAGEALEVAPSPLFSGGRGGVPEFELSRVTIGA